MVSPAELQQERNKLFNDFFNNITPKRMPVILKLPLLMIAEQYGLSQVDYQFDYGILADGMEEMAGWIFADQDPFGGVGMATRPPMYNSILGSNSFQMAESGYMQHPEVLGMEPSEYGELIEDPFKCIIDHVMPRQFGNLDLKANPVRAFLAIQAADMELAKDCGSLPATLAKTKAKYGFYSGAPMGSGGFTSAPFDFIADQLRGFSGISTDIRRCRKQLIEASEAVLPYVFNLGLPPRPHAEGFVMMPLHMAPFMRPKDVEEMWFPTFKKQLEQYAARNVRARAVCEADWTRFADLLHDLPAATWLKFEDGDAQRIKNALGDKILLGGCFPLINVRACTPAECIDKAKALLDIMLPGGGYLFDTDKMPLNAADVNMETYRALTEFLHEYAVYDNAGEPFGQKLNSENFSIDPSVTEIRSAYLDELTGSCSFAKTATLAETRMKASNINLVNKVLRLFL